MIEGEVNLSTLQRFHKLFLIAASFGAAFLALASAAYGGAKDTPTEPDPFIVVLKDDVAHPANLAHRHEDNRGAEVSHIYGAAIKGYSADLTPGQLKAIKKDPNVDYVESDGVIRPKGQAVGNQLKRVYANMSQLHIDENDLPADRVNADIAILDTGVYPHPDLNIVSRVVCVEGGGGCKPGQADDDLSGHGTHVAGDAAAIDNGIGMVGTAPGARIWSVKVVTRMSYAGADQVGTKLSEPYDPAVDLQLGNAQMSDAIAGIDWVTAHSSEIEVANMSFACVTADWGCARTALKEAIATSVNSGVVWVAAAGHDGDAVTGIEQVGVKHRYYPALLSDVITVSAMADYDGLPGSLSNSNGCPLEKGTQVDDRLMGPGKLSAGTEFLPKGSNYGREVDITAPGSCVFSTWSPYPLSNRYDIPYKAEYGFMYGSSVASALVAGAAADIAAQYNPNSRADVENIRAALLGAGNFNWEDLRIDDSDSLVSPDGVKEPLLDLHALPLSPTPPPPPIPQPTVTMGGVTNLAENSATLNGTVNPNGHDGRYRFVCNAAGSGEMKSTPEGAYFAAGSSPINVSWTVGGLYPGASYSCYLEAWNVGTEVYSSIASFKTLGAPRTNSGYYYPDTDSVNMFYAQANGALTLKYNDYGPGGGWKVAQLPGAPVVGPISAIRRVNNDVLAFYRSSTDSKIHITWLNHLTSKWETTGAMSGPATGPPSAIERNNGDMHAVYRGTDGAIHDLWFDKSNPAWKDQWLGGDPLGDPSITTRSDNGQIHIFYRHVNGHINVLWLSGNTWQDAYLGGSAAGDPKAFYRPDADLSTSAFYKGTDGKLHDVWNDASGWHDVALGGTPAGNAAPVYSTKNGNIHVFYRSTTGSLRDMWLNAQNNVWTDAQVAGGNLVRGTPSPVNRTKNGDIHVFSMRSEGHLYDSVFDGASWVDTLLQLGGALDTDSDEVFDPADWCPTRSGVATNYGCAPERQQTSAGYYLPKLDSVNTFYARADGTLMLKYNDYGLGGGWKLAQLPGAPVVGPISSITRTNGDILAFYRSTDSKIHITWIDHNTSQWLDAGAMTGPAAGPPSAVERNNGDMHVVYRGTDGAIHDLWFNNKAPKWTDQGLNATGVVAGEPSITTRSDNGQVHIFYRNSQGAISVLWLSGNTWQDSWLGGSAAGDPKALYRPDADLSTSAFYKGTDGKLHDVWNDASGWHDVALGGTPAAKAVPIYSTKTGNVHVFYRSTTGYLRDMWLNSQNNVWTDAQVAGGGLMKGTPSPVNRTKNGDLNVFYVRSDGSLYDAVFNGTTWTDTSIQTGAAIPTD